MSRLIPCLLMILPLFVLPNHLAAQEGGSWLRELAIHEPAFVQAGDGSTYIGGWWGGLSGNCVFGSQAFLKKVDENGLQQWHKVGHTPLPIACCADDTPAEICNNRENTLLDMLTGIDTRYIVASQIYDLAIDQANETLAMTGELLVAWDDPNAEVESNVKVVKGAFVALLTLEGSMISDAYLGPQPAGPPVPGLTCTTLCERGKSVGEENYGGRGVAFGADGHVIVTGWTSAANSERDIFVASYDSVLSERDWVEKAGEGGDDCALDAVVDRNGAIFVTGYGGFHRDTFMAKFSKHGQQEILTYASGPGDDEGRRLEIGEDGVVTLHGRLTGECSFGEVAVGVGGNKQQEFVVEFDENLVPSNGHAGEPFVITQHLQQTPTAGGHIEHPVGVKFLRGKWGTGGVDEILLSDDHHLRLYSGSTNQIIFLATFQLPREPLELKRIRLETRSESCYTLSLSVQGFDDGLFGPVGQPVDICPGDEAAQVFQLTKKLSHRLGIDGISADDVQPILAIKVEVEFRQPQLSLLAGQVASADAEPACQACKASMPGVDVDMDLMEAEVEY